LLVALALAASAATASIAVQAALAHESDCHAQQTCPSDDHSYIWSDGETQWDCGVAGGPELAEATMVIVYEGEAYACTAVGSDAETGEETPTPAPTPTTAPPPPTATPRTRRKEPPPRRRAPRPARKTREPTPTPTPEPETQASSPPFRVSLPPSNSVVLPARRYVFPVDGPVSFADTFGAPRANVGWHHGEDIFAPLGTPVVAVAAGTLLKVGWNDIGGNRVWLRDRWGNYFYYAHLAGFAPGIKSGVRVQAGAVIGYVGNTGDAVGTPYHLHFEIHPASLLDLGYDGVVNPFSYLSSWPRLEELRTRPARVTSAPTPGAILLTAADISSASGLEPDSLMKSATAPVAVERGDRPLLSPVRPSVVARIRRGGRRSDELADLLDASASSLVPQGPSASVWDALAECESGQDWHANTGIYDGGLQFHPGTWTSHGGGEFAPYAYLATREQQIAIARRVLATQGWAAWPACSLKLGLR
jgi:murein DD-endopeptidase MepM/ murein hydrolase activator NlpD